MLADLMSAVRYGMNYYRRLRWLRRRTRSFTVPF
jgi:hypothetical protein